MSNEIKLTDNQIAILGRPNFACANIAKFLIQHGVYEDKAKKAEYEQAVFIHFALGMLERYGDKWADESGKFLEALDNQSGDNKDEQPKA